MVPAFHTQHGPSSSRRIGPFLSTLGQKRSANDVTGLPLRFTAPPPILREPPGRGTCVAPQTPRRRVPPRSKTPPDYRAPGTRPSHTSARFATASHQDESRSVALIDPQAPTAG